MRNSTHKLKSWPEYFEATLSGVKTFELRENDRDFQVGDLVILEEYNPETIWYMDRSQMFEITYVLTSGPWLRPGYCAFGIKKVEK